MVGLIINVLFICGLIILLAFIIQKNLENMTSRDDQGKLLKEELKKITRVEVIDENGRSYVNWDKNNIISLSFQDEGRTLKVFIDKKIN